ncbi:DNA double-strand break repair nuclease NurA [Halalkalibacter sp. APA_J-10(15)]|uniref:DNA double-strand break repair nuclease NurA n=1 Tax=unclassified Halalkalibacter TaxID=2893063 RepID=UPI001FF0F417|nr:DNA double-strand break repair nuclease NurA [Halalkalibacter sp. APA_J-10(15)]MCK0473610.1 DNA double-strand break repair nuclease NurA [Halalkalibacter sp. APA_J-10(15)]
MIQFNPDLLEKIRDINHHLEETYAFLTREKDMIRQKLAKIHTDHRQINLLSVEELTEWLDGQEVAAVDGSVNQTKGEYPHVLYFFQALAKTTTGHQCMSSEIYTPLMERENNEQTTAQIRSHMLAKHELEVAYKLIDERRVRLLLMDGALYHYRIDAPNEWEQLRQKALKEDVLLVGVSEEITTENLVKLSEFSSYERYPHTYDRDLLFGVLKQGELLYIEEIQHKAGLQSVWVRLSTDPAITGFDILMEQAEYRDRIAEVLQTLTPKDGRGIPLWLDMIDREVRVTDSLVEAMVEQYIHPQLKQRFFTKKRTSRPY